VGFNNSSVIGLDWVKISTGMEKIMVTGSFLLKQDARRNWLPVLLIAINLAVGAVVLKMYVLWQSVHFLLSVGGFLLTIDKNRASTGNLRALLVAGFFAAMAFVLPKDTVLFFAIVFSVLAIIDNFFSKTTLLSVLVLVFMSPFFQFVSNIFTFPIRLSLTRYAGKILQITGGANEVAGNVIYYRGNEFAVDPECMGLNMMITSLLLVVVLFAYLSGKYMIRRLPGLLAALLVIVFLLNVFSNLLRILLIVHFAVLPENAAHEWIGLCCFLAYVVIPGLWFGRLVVKKWGTRREIIERTSGKKRMAPYIAWLHLVLLVVVFFAANHVYQQKKLTVLSHKKIPGIEGFRAQHLAFDVLKLESSHALIYIKEIPGFYSADHNPSICWKGSGYQFQQVQEEQVFGIKIYTAVLKKNEDALYTAWWYDNGHRRTIEQLKWRWDVLRGGYNYSIVNITTASRKQLMKELEHSLGKGGLQSVFTSL
jgi:exosortase N